MRRILTILVLGGMIGPWVLAGAAAGWDATSPPPPTKLWISASDTETIWSTDPWVGERTLYLWISAPWYEAEACEFGFVSTLPMVDLITREGVENLGTIQSPRLEFASCVEGEVVAEIVVVDSTGTGGTVCVQPSDGGKLCYRRCSDELWVSLVYHGFASDGTSPCHGYEEVPDCIGLPIAAVPGTWGTVKALYD